MISLFLEAFYLFQPLVDSGLNQMFQSFQRMGIDAFDSKSILPLMIYIFVVKLSFLWRIPFLIYGFLWVKGDCKRLSRNSLSIHRVIAFCPAFLPGYVPDAFFPLSPNPSRCRSAGMVDFGSSDFCGCHRFAL